MSKTIGRFSKCMTFVRTSRRAFVINGVNAKARYYKYRLAGLRIAAEWPCCVRGTLIIRAEISTGTWLRNRLERNNIAADKSRRPRCITVDRRKVETRGRRFSNNRRRNVPSTVTTRRQATIPGEAGGVGGGERRTNEMLYHPPPRSWLQARRKRMAGPASPEHCRNVRELNIRLRVIVDDVLLFDGTAIRLRVTNTRPTYFPTRVHATNESSPFRKSAPTDLGNRKSATFGRYLFRRPFSASYR